jgi:hypothetical protein
MKAVIAAAVLIRADGHCEACGCPFNESDMRLRRELDHAEGRAVSESVETVWALHAKCHADRHASRPSKAEWLKRWADFCARQGYREAYARAFEKLRWAEQKAAFGRAS